MSIKYFCDSCKKEIVFSDSVHFEQEDNDRGVTYFQKELSLKIGMTVITLLFIMLVKNVS